LLDVCVAALPFFLLSLVAVLIITFVPALSIGVVRLFDL